MILSFSAPENVMDSIPHTSILIFINFEATFEEKLRKWLITTNFENKHTIVLSSPKRRKIDNPIVRLISPKFEDESEFELSWVELNGTEVSKAW